MNAWIGFLLTVAVLYYLWKNPTLWQGARKEAKNREQWINERDVINSRAKSRREEIEIRSRGRDLTESEKIELKAIDYDWMQEVKESNTRWAKYLN